MSDIGDFATYSTKNDHHSDLIISTSLWSVLGLYLIGFVILSMRSLITSSTGKMDKSIGVHYHRSIHRFYEDIFPSTFRAESWFYIWWWRLLHEHLIVSTIASLCCCGGSTSPTSSMVMNRNSSITMRSVGWTIAMSKWVIYLFVNCVIAKLMYADDGHCGDQTTQSSCDNAVTAGSYFRVCDWHTSGAYCSFHPPSIDYFTIILLSFLVTFVSEPIYQLAKHLISRLETTVTSLNSGYNYESRKKYGMTDEVLPLSTLNDEFRSIQSFRSKVLRSARLEMLRKHCDNISPSEEMLNMMVAKKEDQTLIESCLLYTSPSPRDRTRSRMPSSA